MNRSNELKIELLKEQEYKLITKKQNIQKQIDDIRAKIKKIEVFEENRSKQKKEKESERALENREETKEVISEEPKATSNPHPAISIPSGNPILDSSFAGIRR